MLHYGRRRYSAAGYNGGTGFGGTGYGRYGTGYGRYGTGFGNTGRYGLGTGVTGYGTGFGYGTGVGSGRYGLGRLGNYTGYGYGTGAGSGRYGLGRLGNYGGTGYGRYDGRPGMLPAIGAGSFGTRIGAIVGHARRDPTRAGMYRGMFETLVADSYAGRRRQHRMDTGLIADTRRTLQSLAGRRSHYHRRGGYL